MKTKIKKIIKYMAIFTIACMWLYLKIAEDIEMITKIVVFIVIISANTLITFLLWVILLVSKYIKKKKNNKSL